MTNKTAILIFSNSAKEDAKRKSFSDSKLFETLTNDTIKKVKKTGLPFFHFTEIEQQGTNFGSRFSNAIQAIFDKGFTNIISIGNDTPHLKAKHLKQANRKLIHNQCVFGPSQDGGFYLMGLTKASFKAEAFKKLPWQTPTLKTATLRLFVSSQNEFQILETLKDIDSFHDVKIILNSFKTVSKELKTLLLRLCISAKAIPIYLSTFYRLQGNNCYFNKGSPLLVSIKN
ncbi:TIGR04282 family arsenosugar biosynthesis glycosyltransferase [Lacinutrix cladophorae]